MRVAGLLMSNYINMIDMHARSPPRCGTAKLYAYVPKLVLEFVMTN